MNAAYVGTLTPGSTSRMRAEWLRNLTEGSSWTWIDTDSAMLASSRIWQSAAYRLKVGPAMQRLNDLVVQQAKEAHFDIVWVDKAVFLYPETVRQLRKSARRLVHYTPDAAFHSASSRHFEETLALYDLLVTTKAFDVAEYTRRSGKNSVLLTTQGYDKRVHYPHSEDAHRRKEIVFVGLAERDRETCIEALLEAGLRVRLAGIGWDALLRRHSRNERLAFETTGAFGDAYAKLLSTCWIGLGLLSKRFPELHTTRTFEIPACGTILATERTSDTKQFFSEDEVLFFNNYREVPDRVTSLFADGAEGSLAAIASRGRSRVLSDRRDYESILGRVLADPRLAD